MIGFFPMRTTVLTALLMSATPALAATYDFDLSMNFDREYFQDVYDSESGDNIPVVFDGSPYGFEGTFSNLAPGALTSARITLEDGPSGDLSLVSCEFAGQSCSGDMISLSSDGKKLFVGSISDPTISIDMAAMTAEYYEDGPGGYTDAGEFNFYGAQFKLIAEDLVEAPLPASAALLLGGLAVFGVLRRRRA
ncbi:VPLPA-CTERM sorting domain-containing protein [Silicimonas algicola]|nr:VPLPA-CTERM sorting domain-containing protein [Silicimonas algicola]AZQ66905.1 VPLPA-CTERM sorting domain-containing protein [Silicimonas algicola]